MARTPPFRDAGGRPLAGSIAEAGFWTVGGDRQWVMVRGRSLDNPVLVMIHGGPGMPQWTNFRVANAALEDAYTVIYWDQRGAGRSYSKAIDPKSLTIDRFIADLGDLVDQARTRFAKAKVVLLGHSWGSVLGVMYVAAHPETVAAYVGVGQVADMVASEAASYAFVLEAAKAAGKEAAVRQLTAIGPPPHNPKALQVQRRWLMALGGAHGPDFSLVKMMLSAAKAPEFSLLDVVRMYQGMNLALEPLWLALMTSNIQRDFRRLDAPVFFALGRYDHQVVATVAAAYFEVIEAPHKQLTWFEDSGHFPPFEEPERFNRLLIDDVRPFAL